MSKKVFDPANVELPSIMLLGNAYQLAETTASQLAQVSNLQAELEQIDGEVDLGENVADLEMRGVELMCEMIAVAVESHDGLGAELFDAFKSNEISLQYIQRAAEYMQGWASESEQAGND